MTEMKFVSYLPAAAAALTYSWRRSYLPPPHSHSPSPVLSGQAGAAHARHVGNTISAAQLQPRIVLTGSLVKSLTHTTWVVN